MDTVPSFNSLNSYSMPINTVLYSDNSRNICCTNNSNLYSKNVISHGHCHQHAIYTVVALYSTLNILIHYILCAIRFSSRRGIDDGIKPIR